MDFTPPPAIYDHPFPGKVIEMRLPDDQVALICKQVGGIACAVHKDGTCYVWMRKDAGPEVLRHEIAHCLGWPANHR